MKYLVFVLCCWCVSITQTCAQTPDSIYRSLEQLAWKPILADTGQTDWQQHWSVDGDRATLKATPQGRLFCAGPIAYDNGSHAVMWTKQSFSGPIKVEYDYVRADDISRFVNIIYVQATGIGEPPYTKDISEWDSLRTIPTMSKYFTYMNAYHISFAAFDMDNEDPDNDYVRARRYPVAPDGNFTEDTALKPDYTQTGLFKPGVRYHITIIKNNNHLTMHVEGDEKSSLFYWDTSAFPPVEAGWVGFRHMYTRCAKYDNVRIYGLP
ncbi:hypothetical protein [Tunicatimonas pelagia]|uniref:hypothetical protein n=1 Tax=Tunicatimonas pelagia TaxID=931531 RepID=UPI0026661DAD|nr:hypothetical protein [Tunicatimonas pelagia]WKN44944.1 hypothetical protein P0M28_08205 [Tunicatimonas pelagia]